MIKMRTNQTNMYTGVDSRWINTYLSGEAPGVLHNKAKLPPCLTSEIPIKSN